MPGWTMNKGSGSGAIQEEAVQNSRAALERMARTLPICVVFIVSCAQGAFVLLEKKFYEVSFICRAQLRFILISGSQEALKRLQDNVFTERVTIA
jgi:hypothetical protein